MPAKNVLRQFAGGHYYHVYNRGVAKQPIFIDQADKRYFLSIFDRHLNPDSELVDKTGQPYKKLNDNLELLSYCLMGNHYHLLFYLADETSIKDFMRSLGVAYTMYFNLRYKRVGPIFQGVYKASLISNDEYLQHISRYIHLNPRSYQTYKYSSYRTCAGERTADSWHKPDRLLALFNNDTVAYAGFVADYEEEQIIHDEIKRELANF